MMFTELLPLSKSEDGGNILDIEHLFICENSANTYIKYGIYNFTTMTAKLKTVYYTAGPVTITGDNIEATHKDYTKLIVTALNDYYLYKFSTNVNGDGIGLVNLGKNATETIGDDRSRYGDYFVSPDPDLVSKFTETWIS